MRQQSVNFSCTFPSQKIYFILINAAEEARALALGIDMSDDHTIGQIALYIT
jgi:hypothetical protein